jgi:hypothetical protein
VIVFATLLDIATFRDRKGDIQQYLSGLAHLRTRDRQDCSKFPTPVELSSAEMLPFFPGLRLLYDEIAMHF